MQLLIITVFSGLLAFIATATAVADPVARKHHQGVDAYADLFPNADKLLPPIDMVVVDPSVPKKRWSQYHFYCYDPNFHGRCVNMEANVDQCYNLVDGWADQTTASGPDKGISCILYTTWGCAPTNGLRILRYPDSADLGQIGIDDKAKSFRSTIPRQW